MEDRPVGRALISVYDKTGIIPFAEFLSRAGVELVATEGSAKVLKEAGLKVTELSDYTGYPEMLSGRVKSLHPKIHGGLLFSRGNEEHEATVKKHGIGPIDIAVVNLYPFEKVVGKLNVSVSEIIENIDVGGPALIRSAAKNYASVAVIVDPNDYDMIIDEIKSVGGITPERRKDLAGKAFAKTATYDAAIAAYLGETNTSNEMTCFCAPLVQPLRYGENPHQKGALYGNWQMYYKQLQGKELSYNNILDLTAAAELISEFKGDAPTVAIVKHTSPCGVGQDALLSRAWEKAYETDRQAPFGGVIASSVEIDGDTAKIIKEIFCEVIVAPSFSEQALATFSEKQNVRLIQLLKDLRTGNQWRMRSVGAESFIMQETDMRTVTEHDLRIVTKRQPTPQEIKAMLFAWKVAKHVKSNAIVYAGEERTLGIGAGQMSRVDASKIAVRKADEAGLSLSGAAMASDGFFPFPDSLIAAAESGAMAVIQPGGSIKDADIIKAADERNMVMAFTGVRHLRH